MATKSISQLDTQATANETDLFEVAIVDANSASGYASKKESAAAIADAIVGEYQYPLRITGTTAKTIAGAINELKNLVDLLPQFAIEVVQTLPVSDISETTIYLVPAQDPEQGNYYEEYIYVNNAWELVGTTAVDLSGYYTSAQVDTLLAAKANTSSLATVATSGAYSDLSGKPTIDTTLDTTSTNAVENRAVASEINSIKSDITVEGSASGDIATFVDGSDNPLKELKISIEAVQSGSGDPSPTNIRPITGWTGAKILRANENLFSMDGDVIAVDASPTDTIDLSNKSLIKGIASNGYLRKGNASYSKDGNIYTITSINTSYGIGFVCPIVGNKSYYISCNASSNIRLRAVFYSNKFISSTGDITSGQTVSAPVNAEYLVLMARTLNDNQTIENIQVGASNAEYNSVSVKSIFNIDWQSTAGTVYGGTLNVKTGELKVTHANIASYDGETINEPWISSMDKYVAGVTPTTGAQVVYPLTDPVTYQLPPTEIRSLLGLNNVFADCGAVTELKYTRDLNLCINDIISRIEALEGASSSRSMSLSPVLTKSIVSDSDTAEGKTEETEEETKEEAQKNER